MEYIKECAFCPLLIIYFSMILMQEGDNLMWDRQTPLEKEEGEEEEIESRFITCIE